MAKTAADLVKSGEKVLRRFKNGHPKEKKLAQELETILQTTKKIIYQAEEVNSGNYHLPDRMVSVCDPTVRPIVKGKLGKKVEFGYKVQIEETENGIISGHEVYPGNPSDENLLDDAMNRHESTFKKPPRDVAADRGYGRKDNIEKL
jgi:IS5 family transposase